MSAVEEQVAAEVVEEVSKEGKAQEVVEAVEEEEVVVFFLLNFRNRFSIFDTFLSTVTFHFFDSNRNTGKPFRSP